MRREEKKKNAKNAVHVKLDYVKFNCLAHSACWADLNTFGFLFLLFIENAKYDGMLGRDRERVETIRSGAEHLYLGQARVEYT